MTKLFCTLCALPRRRRWRALSGLPTTDGSESVGPVR
ncbi:hypothetical protein LTSEWAN_3967, partial [Salmonella enterica subsp. enterica serovar Wandsworth str. A4-580]